MATNIEF